MKEKRNVGLDLLRIVAMMMVMTLHYLGKGGAWSIDTKMKYVVWFMEIFCMISVNLYVLISGYFLVNSKFTWKKVLKLCTQVWFYSLLFLFIEILLHHDIADVELKNSVFPILMKTYWFITIYILLYVLSPYLNMIVNNATKKEYQTLLGVLIFVFSIVHLFVPDYAEINKAGGYGIIWLVIVYLIAGYIKKYNDNLKFSKIVSLIICFISTVIIMLFSVHIKNPNLSPYVYKLYQYNSIFIIINSIIVFKLFLNLKIENKIIIKTIKFFAPLTFGVYLIHENMFVTKYLYSGIFSSLKWAYRGIGPFVLNYILFVCGIFIVCALMDYIRIILFKGIGKLAKAKGRSL